MLLAGHGIRIVVAALVTFTTLAWAAPALHGASNHQATYLCPPVC